MDKFIVGESMKMEISKEEYKTLIKIEEKYTLLVLGLLKHAKLFSGNGKMYIVSAEEVLAIVDPREYKRRLEELIFEREEDETKEVNISMPILL